MLISCDIDGTFADNTHRLGFIDKGVKDWGSFYHPLNLEADRPIEKAVRVLKLIARNPLTRLSFLTGRPERTRSSTVEWITKHFGPGFYYDRILMRGDNDHRKAVVYKEEQIQVLRSMHAGTILFIDDDVRNLDMYWKYGVPLKAPECWDNIPLLSQP